MSMSNPRFGIVVLLFLLFVGHGPHAYGVDDTAGKKKELQRIKREMKEKQQKIKRADRKELDKIDRTSMREVWSSQASRSGSVRPRHLYGISRRVMPILAVTS
jgi:hypothetical protein